MKYLIINFLLFFVIQNVFATETKIYYFGSLQMAFEKVDGLMVNRACNDKKCDAYKKGMKFKNASLSPELLKGGRNPSAVRCKELMGGMVLIGRDKKKNAQSFCRFLDDSYLR